MSLIHRISKHLTRPTHLTAALLLATGVWLTACGADIALSGANLAGAGDGSLAGSETISGNQPGQDGTTTADGGTTVQPDGTAVPGDTSVMPGDTSTPPPNLSCQGKCGQAKPNQWTCQCDSQCAKYNDCCADYQALCSDPVPNVSELMQCLAKACPKQVDACLNQQPCASFWNCAQQCSDGKCIESCTQGLDMQALAKQAGALEQCANASGCDGTTNPGGPICGDGKCEQPENSLNCGKDCPNTPPGEVQVCLSKLCPSQYKACFGNPDCVAAVACMNDGGSPQECAAGDPTVGKQLQQMLQCGQQNGCLGGVQPGPVCGNGQCEPGESSAECPQDCKPSAAVCGNGKCEPGESANSCPKDCKMPIDPITQCIANACPDLYKQCSGSASCISAAQCLIAGGSMMQCVTDMKTAQLVSQLVQCGTKANCLGGTTTPATCKGQCGVYSPGAACQCDAKCAQNGNCCGDYKTYCGAPPVASCQGKCGSFDPNASCQCNISCQSFGNCCSDYQKVCGVTPSPVCGDGVCTAPETATSCAKDCSVTPPAIACKSKADCATGEICCGKADGSQVCSTPANCY
ncbi:MAG: hypothetical protein HY902_10885 [Deltaproteobacteria bacterium]|nr:hypothetical protein [Deltaproteobacteria bacterium]